MVICIPGEYYVYETAQFPAREELMNFFQDLTKNDVMEIRLKSSEDEPPQVFHINQFLLENRLDFTNMAIEKSADSFEDAAKSCSYDIPAPILDSEGNCISIVKKVKSYYSHSYQYEGLIDVSFLNRYSCIALAGLNEYSVELYKRALPLWSGEEVFLIGAEWEDYIDTLPALSNARIRLFEETKDLLQDMAISPKGKFLYILEGIPQNGDDSRHEDGILFYDEVMTLTFLFSHVIHPGPNHPDKKFLLIDGYFYLEGVYAICEKVFTAARYAMAKGYLPVFQIISSNDNIYSDHEGDDIWNKFFLQPGNYTLQEALASQYVAVSPNMNILNVVHSIMNDASQDARLVWPQGIFNGRINKYIQERRNRFLPVPDRTLGVLIRGTDYINNPLPNHKKHASVDMVIDKIREVEDTWDFDRLYLATEDESVCSKMAEHFKARIRFTDQKRYTVKPGQLLVELHGGKEEGKGFLLGAEYICSVCLLSQCNSLIASGECGALTEALRENNGRYEHVYVFELS